MNNNAKNIVVSIVMIVYFIGMTFFCLLKPVDAFSESERRSLATRPEVSMENITSGKYMKDFEQYAVDQFPLRDEYRAVKAFTNYYVLNMSDNNGIYIKDGHINKLEYPLNEEQLSYAAKRFKYVYDKYLAETDVNAYLSIIPDKNYYLAGKGQLSIDYDELIRQMREQTDFLTYIDITDCLTIDSFYRTDTHWQQDKILPVAERLAEKMNISLSNEYVTETLDKEFYGVYYGQAALPFAPDTIRYLNNDILKNVKVYDHQNGKEISVYEMDKAYGKDPYEMFLAGPLSLVTIENEQNKDGKELVVFRDSFGSSLIPLLAEGYSKITLVDIRYMHPDMAAKFVEFDNQDVLFMYSTAVLNNSQLIK